MLHFLIPLKCQWSLEQSGWVEERNMSNEENRIVQNGEKKNQVTEMSTEAVHRPWTPTWDTGLLDLTESFISGPKYFSGTYRLLPSL